MGAFTWGNNRQNCRDKEGTQEEDSGRDVLQVWPPFPYPKPFQLPASSTKCGKGKGKSLPASAIADSRKAMATVAHPAFTIPQMQERTLILLEVLPFSQAKRVPSHPCHSGNMNVDAHEKQVNTWSTGGRVCV